MITTYLWGAGASAQSIPTINKFSDKLKERIKHIQNFIILYLKNEEEIESLKKLVENLIELKDICRTNPTVDTYAYKLIAKRDFTLLYKFKFQLSLFIFIEHIMNGNDKRYDNFIAATLKNELINFKDNLRIISWNYDIQFQSSYLGFTNNKKFEIAEDELNMQVNKHISNKNIEKFGFYKLNGSCGFTSDRNKTYSFLDNFELESGDKFKDPFFEATSNENKLIMKLAKVIPNYVQTEKSGLYFAVENRNPEVINNCIENTKDTNILVVIGYSFPSFNRVVDSKVLNSMKNLNRVYIQDTDPEAIQRKMRDIISSNSIEFTTEKVSDSEFYILNEFFENKLSSKDLVFSI